MNTEEHPVIKAIREFVLLRPRDLDFFIRHGKPYRGVPLPPKTPRWSAGQCIAAATTLEKRKGWPVVYGFGLIPADVAGTIFPVTVDHAWNTIDGETAYDATFPQPQRCSYWAMGREHDGRFRQRMLADEPDWSILSSDLSPGILSEGLRQSLRL